MEEVYNGIIIEYNPETKLFIATKIYSGFYNPELTKPISDKNLIKVRKKVDKMVKKWRVFTDDVKKTKNKKTVSVKIRK